MDLPAGTAEIPGSQECVAFNQLKDGEQRSFFKSAAHSTSIAAAPDTKILSRKRVGGEPDFLRGHQMGFTRLQVLRRTPVHGDIACIRNTYACRIGAGKAEAKRLRIDGRRGKHLVAAVYQMSFGINKARTKTFKHLAAGRDRGARNPPAFAAAENSLVMAACELSECHRKCELAGDCIFLPDYADIGRK